MPELPHLILPRAEVELERRKKRGFGQKITKDVPQQTERVRLAVDEALAVHSRLRANLTDPALIVRVRTSGLVSEEEWTRAGLDVLGHDVTDAVVLFSSDAELTEFRRRLEAYAAGIPQGQGSPSYNALIASIEDFGPLRPEDRIGGGLLDEGFERLEAFADDREFVLDVELWDVGTQDSRVEEADRLSTRIAERGGEVTDQYIGVTFTALRIRAGGNAVRYLLELPIVRMIDLPPQVDLEVAPLLATTVRDLGEVEPPDEVLR